MEFYTQPVPSLSHWSSLETILAQDVTPPVLPSIADYQQMSPTERRLLDAKRKQFVAGQMTINTPPLKELITTVATVMAQNHHAPTGRRGILLSGPSTVGKTTACLALMRRLYVEFEQQCPDLLAAGAVPVAYVEVPPSCTPKGMMQRFADFYSVAYAERTSLNSLKKSVIHAMRETFTQVVVVDELHNLARISGSNGQSVDTLKDLSNDSPATFIYSGIKVEESGLLAGARGDQVARRFTPIRMKLTASGRDWRGVVNAFWTALPLLAQDAGSPTAEDAKWLHHRSGGNIGRSLPR